MQFWLKTTDLTGEEGERLMAPSVKTSPSPVSGLWSLVTLLTQMWSPVTQMGFRSFARETKLLETRCLFPVFCLYVISMWKPSDVALCQHQGVKSQLLDSVMSVMKELPTSNDASLLFCPLWGALWSVRFLQRTRSNGEFYLYLSTYVHMSLLSISSLSV